MFNTDQFVSKKDLLKWGSALGIEFKKQNARKGEVFLKQSQRCDYFYFIEEGFMRVYYLDLQGNEVTHWFSTKDNFITSCFKCSEIVT